MKVYFFPGLGADSSLAEFHRLPGLDTRWIDWPKSFEPDWEEFLESLLRENHIEPDSIYIGISFGGLVAQRLAGRIRPKKVILIGSLRSAASISFFFRAASPLVLCLPPAFFRIGYLPAWMIGYFFGINAGGHMCLFRRMARNLPGRNAKALIRLALSERSPQSVGIPVISIHGEEDRIIPIGKRRVEFRIKGGGHLISMTHASHVNAILIGQIGA